ncbi:family 1 glycosylhydrolase [Oenococcus oeni]
MNALRISIACTRIFPTGVEEEPNQDGLKFYDSVINEIIRLKRLSWDSAA